MPIAWTYSSRTRLRGRCFIARWGDEDDRLQPVHRRSLKRCNRYKFRHDRRCCGQSTICRLKIPKLRKYEAVGKEQSRDCVSCPYATTASSQLLMTVQIPLMRLQHRRILCGPTNSWDTVQASFRWSLRMPMVSRSNDHSKKNGTHQVQPRHSPKKIIRPTTAIHIVERWQIALPIVRVPSVIELRVSSSATRDAFRPLVR